MIYDWKNQIKLLTGFAGSWGLAFVTQQTALLFVDSRYYIAAQQQLKDPWQMVKASDLKHSIAEELLKYMEPGTNIGINPFRFSKGAIEKFSKVFQLQNINFTLCTDDLLVEASQDSGHKELYNEIEIFEMDTVSCGEKCIKIGQAMRSKNADLLILSALDDIGYLLNLRGTDLDSTPFFYSYALVSCIKDHDDDDYKVKVKLYCQLNKLPEGIEDHFLKQSASVSLHSYDEFLIDLKKDLVDITGYVWASSGVNFGISDSLKDHKLIETANPVCLMKSLKSDQEISNAHIAHHEEAISFFEFMHWLETNYKTVNITELSASDKLAEIKTNRPVKSADKRHRSLSFETIFSVGKNAADIHHTPDANAIVTGKEIVLVDFGSQYLYGTTDTTRTFHLETPTAEEVHHFTLVLKGFIAVAITKPKCESNLNYLEGIARHHLNMENLDFAHSLGHGVGNYGCVHEDPIVTGRIYEETQLMRIKPKMFFSNEPGCYIEGRHGIRIENVVCTYPDKNNHLKLVDLTKIPIQRKMIDTSLLGQQEKDYLNSMNRDIRSEFEYLKDFLPHAYEYMMRNTESF
ncbi:MAG: Xaa-Pro aminopeptidase 1 [Marteilia pararefringens]